MVYRYISLNSTARFYKQSSIYTCLYVTYKSDNALNLSTEISNFNDSVFQFCVYKQIKSNVFIKNNV